MNQNDTSRPWGKVLKARRLALLGSVAGLGIAVLAAGTAVQSQAPFLGEPARAAALGGGSLANGVVPNKVVRIGVVPNGIVPTGGVHIGVPAIAARPLDLP